MTVFFISAFPPDAAGWNQGICTSVPSGADLNGPLSCQSGGRDDERISLRGSWLSPKGCVGSVACSPRRLFQKSGPGADMPALKRQIDARRLKRRSSGKPLISKGIQAEVTSPGASMTCDESARVAPTSRSCRWRM